MSLKTQFLATGIGSVPYTVPEEALDLIFSYFPEVPYWPQLPLRSETEGMLSQCIAPLLKLGIVECRDHKYFFNTEQEEWGAKLAQFYELYIAASEGDAQALDFFKFPEDSAAGFYAFLKHLESNGTGQAKLLKGQVSGPLSVGLALPDQDRKASYYNPQARDVLIKTLAMQGLNQAKSLARFGLPVIVFVDDPGLYASGQSTFITLRKDEIVAELNSIYEAVKSGGAIAGTHSCAGMDWSILFDSEVDIVSFDAFEYFPTVSTYMNELKTFLNRGGILSWGIVPTSENKITDQSVESLEVRLFDNISYLINKGLDPRMLAEQSMITPSCGTGTLSLDMSIKVHQLTRNLSLKLRSSEKENNR